jgi:hypothetical protein
LLKMMRDRTDRPGTPGADAKVRAFARVVPVAEATDELPRSAKLHSSWKNAAYDVVCLREGDIRVVAIERIGELAGVVAV